MEFANYINFANMLTYFLNGIKLEVTQDVTHGTIFTAKCSFCV